ncbi:MAG: BlaB/IND/MUS family subclass B1 metallo-beta-lactamase [Bacteroidetes bacterium]|nr:BlaB/IND/MUS family subclass B1 metallo-beta-lactamase [Bacteroidota bacterium]
MATFKKMKSFFLLFIVFLSCKLNAQSNLHITPLTTNFYIFTTYQVVGGDLIPSNSMYLVTNEGVVLFDTPWDSTQTQPLLDTIMARHNKKVIMSISTHYHDDRTEGLSYLASKGVKTYSSKKTYILGKANNEDTAQHYFYNDTTFVVGNYTFQTYYPGEGHTADNIVVWFPLQKVLYGGCFVKSTESPSIGYVGNANLATWKKSVKNVEHRFKHPAYIIPGHYSWESTKSLRYTKKLIRKYNRTNKLK